jgi:hypothetical protein
METGLSSNAMSVGAGFRSGLAVFAAVVAAPVAAQDDGSAAQAGTPAPAPAAEAPPAPPRRINLMVTVPRGDVNEAQVQECEDRADAGTISGEIVVCRQVGNDGTGLTGTRSDSQKRFAEETAFKGAPRAPDAFGIPDNGKGISLGGVPPPILMIDVGALPKAPVGSDADRIARGLPPLGEERELTEEQEKARREAAGIKTTVPPRPRKKGG